MKYALLNGCKTHIDDVKKGTIGYDCWFTKNKVKACKGCYLQYWKYESEHPELPSGYENETEWHIAWKRAIKDEFCEVILGPNNEHRADIKTAKYVIELQYSPIDILVAKERSDFYEKTTHRRLIWVVNVYKSYRKKIIKTEKISSERNRFLVNWAHQKEWVVTLCGQKNVNVFLDISPTADNLILLWRHQDQLYGKWVKKEVFYDTYLKSVGKSKDKFLECIKNIDIQKFL